MLVKWIQGNKEPVIFGGFCWHHDTKKEVYHSFLCRKIADIYLSCLSPPTRDNFSQTLCTIRHVSQKCPAYMSPVLKQQSTVTNTATHSSQQHSLQSTVYVTVLEDLELASGKEGWAPGLLCTSGLAWLPQLPQQTPQKWLLCSTVADLEHALDPRKYKSKGLHCNQPICCSLCHLWCGTTKDHNHTPVPSQRQSHTCHIHPALPVATPCALRDSLPSLCPFFPPFFPSKLASLSISARRPILQTENIKAYLWLDLIPTLWVCWLGKWITNKAACHCFLFMIMEINCWLQLRHWLFLWYHCQEAK